MAFHCAVRSCSNGSYRLLKWKKQLCGVCNVQKGSRSCICLPPFRLCPFSTAKKNKPMRQKWKNLINRTNEEGKVWSPSKDSRVCSEHFIEGQPTLKNPYPSLNLGYKDADKKVKRMEFFENQSKDKTCNSSYIVVDVNDQKPTEMITSDPPVERIHRDDPVDPSPVTKLFRYSLSIAFIVLFLVFIARKYITKCNELMKEVSKLRTEVNKLKNELKQYRKNSIAEDMLKTDSDVNFFTGISNIELFKAVHAFMTPFVTRSWKGVSALHHNIRKFVNQPKKFWPCRKLSSQDELLLTLMKLRLGLLNKDLASRFKVSESHCSRIFFAWLKALSSVIGSMVFLPTMEQLLATKPQRFRHLPDLHSREMLSKSAIEWILQAYYSHTN